MLDLAMSYCPKVLVTFGTDVGEGNFIDTALSNLELRKFSHLFVLLKRVAQSYQNMLVSNSRNGVPHFGVWVPKFRLSHRVRRAELPSYPVGS